MGETDAVMCGSRRFHSSDPEQRSAAFVREAQKAGMVMLVCIAIWLVAGAGAFWPGWVVLVLGIRLAVLARQAYGQPERIDA